MVLQVILFEIDCAIFCTNLHELFCQFTSWTNWVNSGKFMDNCWISCQVRADIKEIYDDFIIINLYKKTKSKTSLSCHNLSYRIFSKDLVSYNIKGQPPLNGLLMIALPRPLMSCWLIILPPSHSQQRPAQPALPLFCLPKVAARIVAQDPLLKSPKECNEMENGSITFKWKPISATCWSS